MAESSTSGNALDYKKASSKDVQRALLKVTNQSKWTDADSWKFYLKGRNSLFNKISRSAEFQGLDWRNPDNWKSLEQEYVRRSEEQAKLFAKEGEIPSWALDGDWMHRHPEIVQWMRKEHWRNNKDKLKAMFGQGIDGESGELQKMAPNTGGSAQGREFWENVMGSGK